MPCKDELVEKARLAHMKAFKKMPLVAMFLRPVSGCREDELGYAFVLEDGTWYVTPLSEQLEDRYWVSMVVHEGLHRLLKHHERGVEFIEKAKIPVDAWLIAIDVVVNRIVEDAGLPLNGSWVDARKVARAIGVDVDVLLKLSAEAIALLLARKCKEKRGDNKIECDGISVPAWEKERFWREAKRKKSREGKESGRGISVKDVEEEIRRAMKDEDGSLEDGMKRELEKLTEEEKRELMEKAVIAKQMEKYNKHAGIGKGLAGLIVELLEPKVRWEDILRAKLGSWSKRWRTRTYTKPSKKGSVGGILRRGTKKLGVPPVVAIIDVSGSMIGVLGRVFSELERLSKLTRVDVITFDDGVQEVIRNYRGLNGRKISGGGGTMISEALDVASKILRPGSLMVVMSDFYLGDWAEFNEKMYRMPGEKVFLVVDGSRESTDELKKYGTVIIVDER